MALYTVSAGNGIAAADINQIVTAVHSASGIASLDSTSHVVELPARGVRQVGTLIINASTLGGALSEAFVGYNAGNDPWTNGTATLSGFAAPSIASLGGSGVVWGATWSGVNPASGGTHTGYNAQYLNFTTSGGVIRVDISGSLYNYLPTTANWAQFFGLVDTAGSGGIGTANWYAFDNLGSPAGYTSNAPTLPGAGLGMIRGTLLFPGYGAGLHTFIPLLNAGGPASNCVVGFRSVADVNRSFLSIVISELA